MKKYGLTKVLAVILLLVIVASYLVEGREGITHLAVGDTIMSYFQSFYYFPGVSIFILVVGGFYGLLEHVPAYIKIQENIANKVKNKKLGIFIIITIFALLSSLTGLNVLLLIFIPFGISLVLKMGYDKLVALFSTVGAVTVGIIGGIFTTVRDPYDYYGQTFTNFEKFVGLDDAWVNLFPRIALLIVATALLILFVNKYINKNTKVETKKIAEEKKELVSKVDKKETKTKETKKAPTKETKKEVKKENTKEATKKTTTSNKKAKPEPPKTKKPNNKKNLSAAKQDETIVIKKDKKEKIWPFIVIVAILLVFIVLGYFPWNSLFEITIFNDFHTWLTELAIGDFHVFTSIISAHFPAFGTWANAEIGDYLMVMILLAVFSIIIKFVYRIKFDDMFDYWLEGMKKMLPSALIVMLAYTVLICVYNNGFMETIITAATDKFADNIMIHSLITILGSITNVDLYYTTIGVFYPIVNGLSENANLQIFAIAFQSFYGLVQLVGPTSILLVVCLTYTNVSYKEWLKNIWRLILGLFIIIFIVMLIVSLI